MMSAKPMAMGKATAMPLMAIAATSKIFATLKISPPARAHPTFLNAIPANESENVISAWFNEPKVNAASNAQRNTPTE